MPRLYVIALSAVVLAWPGLAAPPPAAPPPVLFVGAGTGTPVDWIGSYYTNALPWRIGAYGAGYNDGGSWTGTQVPVITGPTGFASTAVNYPSGTYVLQFNAPNPAAVDVRVGGDLFGLGNVQVTGNSYQATFTLAHDAGDVKRGLGQIDLSTTAANPVSGFRAFLPGSNPGGLTPNATEIMGRFQGFMTNKENNSEANLNAVTAADLLPVGQNLSTWGSSYDAIVSRANANPNAKSLLVSVPLNAQPSFLAGVAASLKNVRPGIKTYVQTGGEDWNALFPTFNALYQRSQSDTTHVIVNGDGFGRAAEEYGIASLLTAKAIQQDGATNVKAFLNGQGANLWWTQQAVGAIDRNFPGQLHQYVGATGPSYYPGDGLSNNPGSEDALLAYIQGDVGRQNGYLADHAAYAHSIGLNCIVYEASSVGGVLTKGTVPGDLMAQLLADPRAGDLTTSVLNGMASVLNVDGDGVYWFTEPGGAGGNGIFDYWGGQGDPTAPPTRVTMALDAFADRLTGAVPDPAAPLAIAAAGMLWRRRRAA